mmetsp:Transcript_32340/g.71524  ORF Transcript_32340/g.71524 Transcript_32340/m.71524 type:complete len:501 (-) Transcript_32340:34-1536(-)|eukprot:CAMPEP_0202902292 /NCGR_PEP_ID=MMETSP1392-20130828/16772_1 /ASSEMBLY_ACC=CAM_ASM_000868 /TAXON_ID=225041 /ORGANISM="Chlamydomonas chlamydogama, Strain SAG 11-48b" /LENGTH=500 /DNA_ID=CAMNT_0049589037 /DNA_START=293 /DNA_END=1795 /DNA_ORIENTATION=-
MAPGPAISNSDDPAALLRRNIPESERNAGEQQYARGADLHDLAVLEDCSKLEGAARFAVQFLAAQSHGMVVRMPPVKYRMWYAMKHVEHLTQVRFKFVDQTSLREISWVESQRRVQQGRQWTFTVSVEVVGPAGAVAGDVVDTVDPAVFTRATAQELAILLVSLDALGMSKFWPLLTNLLKVLIENPAVVTSRLPELAQLQPQGLLNATDWEAVFMMQMSRAMQSVAGQQAEGSPAHKGYFGNALNMARQVVRLWPDRPLTHVTALDCSMSLEVWDLALTLARNMYRLGDERQYDYASALGRYKAAYALARGGDKQPTFRLGELRALAAEAPRARLKRWGMHRLLKRDTSSEKELTEMVLPVWKDSPDSQQVPVMTPQMFRPVDMSKPLPPGAFVNPAIYGPPPTGRTSGASSSASTSGTAATGDGAAPPAVTFTPKVDEEGQRLCDGCGMCFLSYKRCGACKQPCYCSVECQRAHWAAGHKRECKLLVEAARAAAGASG